VEKIRMMHIAAFHTRRGQTSYFISVRIDLLSSNYLLMGLKERSLGGLDVFLPYVKDYVNTFTGKSITTDQWKEHLYAYFVRNDAEKIKVLDSIAWEVGFRDGASALTDDFAS
jgi:hypothetical protein